MRFVADACRCRNNGEFNDGSNGWTFSSFSEGEIEVAGGMLTVDKENTYNFLIKPSYREAIKSNVMYSFVYAGSGLTNICVRIHKDTGWDDDDFIVVQPGELVTFTTGTLGDTDYKDRFAVMVESSEKEAGTSGVFDYFYLVEGGVDNFPNDIVATATTVKPTETVAKELLVNGEFLVTDTDSGEFGWDVSETAHSSNIYNSGSFTVQNKNVSKEGMNQQVDFIPGHTYTFSCEIVDGTVNVSFDGESNYGTAISGNYSVTFVATESMNQVRFTGYKSNYTITYASLYDCTGGGTITRPSRTTTMSQTATETTATSVTKTTATETTATTGKQTVSHVITVSLGAVNKTTAHEGEIVTITADTPAQGLAFDKWVGDGVIFADANSAETTFVMPNRDTAIAATYKLASYKVVVIGGTADKAEAVPGSIVTVTATIPEGYALDKWSCNDVIFADAAAEETTFMMPSSAVTVVAIIKEVSHATETKTAEKTGSTKSTESSAIASITSGTSETAASATTSSIRSSVSTETKATTTVKTSGTTEPRATANTTEKSAVTTSTKGSTPSSVISGDANGDGAVNMKDVLAVRKYLADMGMTGFDMIAADVNGDGAVNMKDVLMLRKYLAGIITELHG